MIIREITTFFRNHLRENPRAKVLVYSNILTLIFTTYYIYVFNFSYEIDVTKVNPILFLFYCMGISSIPLYLQTQKLNIPCVLNILCGLGIFSTLILLAGGIHAPGINWLIILPIFIGSLFGQRGTQFGVVLCLFYLLALHHTDEKLNLPNILNTYELFHASQVRNVVLLVIFSAIFFQLYDSMIKDKEKKLKESHEKIKTLMSVLIHDVATPLQTVSMRSQYLKKRFPDEFKEFQKQEKAIKQIHEIINQVREFQALEDGKIVNELEPLNLEKIFLELHINFEMKLNYKNIKLVNKINTYGQTFLGNELQLKNQILANFLSNAIKFSHPNSQIILEAFADQKTNEIIIRITDFGKGIPNQKIQNLFSWTDLTSSHGTSGEKGTGYGMPLAKRYIEEFSGKIEIESTLEDENSPGKTTFTLKFPQFVVKLQNQQRK